MQLTYRGVPYDYTPNPTPKMGPVLATGTYRGQATVFRALAETPAQPENELTWRGVPYRTGHRATAVPSLQDTVILVEEVFVVESVSTPDPVMTREGPAPVSPPAMASVVDRARNLFIRRHQQLRRREQGMMVRLGAEVGLPVDVAASYGSQVQGKAPHDFSGYERSRTAMS